MGHGASEREIELKFQVPPRRRDAVRRWVVGREGAAVATRLQASYFDTPDRALALAGMALRRRREGDRWVQTLKGLGDDGITREEHNCPLGDTRAGTGDIVDPGLHADTAVGRRLLALLADAPAGAGLVCRYGTDILRHTRRLRTPWGSVELAVDDGVLKSGGATQPVCELEIELVVGHPLAVLDVARRWALRHGLWLDTRSKAERGDMLARGQARAEPRRAAPVALRRHERPAQALRRVVAGCRDQIAVNASQVADGDHDDEHVHQLRVGLRRLRSALKLFADDAEAAAIAAALDEPAASLFRRLGGARDAAVLDGEVARRVADVWARAWPAERLPAAVAGLHERHDLQAPDVPHDAHRPGDPGGVESAVAVVRDRDSQALLLDLISVGLPPPPAPWPRGGRSSPAAAAAPSGDDDAVGAALPAALALSRDGPAREKRTRSLRQQLSRRLTRWHRAITEAAARFDELDEEGRHTLRKRIKRLRYAAEFSGSLYDAEAVKVTLKPLKRVQALLGELNDLAVAMAHYRARLDEAPVPSASAAPSPAFALGWAVARREALLASAPPLMAALAEAKRYWKRG